jgi:lariat debranching enzyme
MPQRKQSTADVLKMIRKKDIDHEAATAAAVADAPVASLHVAVQGCCHGELDKIYASCREHELTSGRKIDLLICCGDFQSVRDPGDLDSMAVPPKYRVMGDFPGYYRGEKKAPVLTVFVGGNHEASNVLASQYHGGFIAENIYYLGHSGVVNIAGLRVAGLSGIFKGRDLYRGYPTPPYNSDSVRSAYHVRQFELDKLAMMKGHPIDVFVSHDWPVGITKYGNEAQLLAYKPFFAEDIRHNALGNPKTLALLQQLRPAKWFAAHLHCRFEATIEHSGDGGSGAKSFDHANQRVAVVRPAMSGIGAEAKASQAGFFSFGDDSAGEQQQASCTDSPHKQEPQGGAAATAAGTTTAAEDVVSRPSLPLWTKFVALDKCAKGKNFIDFFDLPVREEARVPAKDVPRCPRTGCIRPTVDPTWAKIVVATHTATPWDGFAPKYDQQQQRAVEASIWAGTAPLPEAATSPAAAETTQKLLDACGLPPLPWMRRQGGAPLSAPHTEVWAVAGGDEGAVGGVAADDAAGSDCESLQFVEDV